jgi:hypothetical protein
MIKLKIIINNIKEFWLFYLWLVMYALVIIAIPIGYTLIGYEYHWLYGWYNP